MSLLRAGRFRVRSHLGARYSCLCCNAHRLCGISSLLFDGHMSSFTGREVDSSEVKNGGLNPYALKCLQDAYRRTFTLGGGGSNERCGQLRLAKHELIILKLILYKWDVRMRSVLRFGQQKGSLYLRIGF